MQYNKMAAVSSDVLLGISVLTTFCAGDVCYYEGKNILDIKSKKCEHGCCGYYYDRSCCDKLPTGVIIGVVVGGVVLIACLAIIALCCWKKKGSQGTIFAVGQQPAPGVAVVSTPQTTQYQTAYNQNPQPQPYIQQGYVYPQPVAANPTAVTTSTVVTAPTQQQVIVT